MSSLFDDPSRQAPVQHRRYVRLNVGRATDFRELRYAFAGTRFGVGLIASTRRGICSLTFGDDADEALAQLARRYPVATLSERYVDGLQQQALAILDGAPADLEWPLELHVPGTAFQVDVWRRLLEVDPGTTTTYGQLAALLDRPQAAQAVGKAVGANRVAWIVPCHRVVRHDGALGGYAWGLECKRAMLNAEARS